MRVSRTVKVGLDDGDIRRGSGAVVLSGGEVDESEKCRSEKQHFVMSLVSKVKCKESTKS